MTNKIIYYEDELNDEFSEKKIIPRKIDSRFRYTKSAFWEACSWFIQNIFSMPIKTLYLKFKFHHKWVGREKIKKQKGVFIYSNHTQAFSDTFTTSVAIYPTRNFLIVNPENISMKGSGWFVELLGAIPVPGDMKATKNFLDRIKNRIDKGYSITIYPEAHIWPYCTWIRNFKDVSFKYPVKMDRPSFVVTNVYKKRNEKSVDMVSYIDGPFYPDKKITEKEAQKKLRDEIYETMCKRAKDNNVEVIKYIKKDDK